MPVFLLPLLNVVGSVFGWLFNTKTGRIVFLATVAAIGFLWWTEHVKHTATEAELAKERAATAAEHSRREQVLDWAQKWAVGAIKNVDDLNAKNADLQKRIAVASTRNNAVACLPADAVDRLRSIGSGQQADH